MKNHRDCPQAGREGVGEVRCVLQLSAANFGYVGPVGSVPSVLWIGAGPATESFSGPNSGLNLAGASRDCR